jgi:sigma-B regulation protein RsbU (phosphoserine phosphatase)
MSLRKRIQILLAFLVALPMALLLYESYQTGRKALVTEMKRQSLQISQLETSKMDLVFSSARLIVEGMVRSMENDTLPSSAAISALLRRTLHDNPDIYGVAVALDPALTKLGRFAPYVCRLRGKETEIILPYEYTKRDWYTLPVKSATARWIKPYFGEGGQTLMVSYSAPLRISGQVVGVVVLDLDLDGLLAHLRSLKPGEYGTAYMLDRSGHILAHPALKAIADPPAEDRLDELAALMKNPGVDAVALMDPISHIKSWIVESPINSLSAAHGGEDWSLIVSWPLAKQLAPLNSMGRRMLVLYLFLGGASIWFLNRTFDDNITRPLRRLAEQAHKYAAGDFSQPAAPLNDAIELRELGKALNTLGKTMNNKSNTNGNTTDSGDTV